MRVLHAYSQHRGGGGANNATGATVAISRDRGLEVEVFTRRAGDLPPGLRGRIESGLTALNGVRTARQFEAVLKAFRPDIVHAHQFFPLIPLAILRLCAEDGVAVAMSCVDYRLTCPGVTHLHDGRVCTRCAGGREYWSVIRNCRGSLSESVTAALYNAIARLKYQYLSKVSRFIVPSEFVRNWLSERAGIDPRRISVLAPAVSIPPEAVDPALGEYIAFAGRFAPEKGIDTLIEAAELTGLPLRLARNVSSLVTCDLPKKAEVVVTDGPDELASFYRGARMLVIPSRWFETFALVGAEAMSHGIPVIVSNIGAVAELVDEDVDGLRFEPGNARDLAEKIRRLWSSPEECRRLGAAARRKVARLWNADRHFERLLKIYEDIKSASTRDSGRVLT